MGLHYNLAASLREMQIWVASLTAELARTEACLRYDSQNLPVVQVTPLKSKPILIVLDPRLTDPVIQEEVVHDELCSRSLVEDTRVRRAHYFLRIIWSEPVCPPR